MQKRLKWRKKKTRRALLKSMGQKVSELKKKIKNANEDSVSLVYK